ncbi:10076_t:CDS:1, partial [Cetraspora pellucida]
NTKEIHGALQGTQQQHTSYQNKQPTPICQAPKKLQQTLQICNSMFPETTINTTLTRIARNIKNQTAKNQHIKNCIERRYQNFQNNTSKMIKSILKKYTDPVILHNIRTHDNIITEPDEIKTAIQEHFKNWTKLNPTQTELWQEWANEYKPIQTIDSTWYDTTTTEIILTELENIIKEAPNTKATGPSKISNEMLKHLGPQAKLM